MRLNAPRGILCFLTVLASTRRLRKQADRLNAPRGILCFLTKLESMTSRLEAHLS